MDDHEDRSEELSQEYVYVSPLPSLSASVTVAVRTESSAAVPEIAMLPTSLTLVTVTVNDWSVFVVPSFALRTTELDPTSESLGVPVRAPLDIDNQLGHVEQVTDTLSPSASLVVGV
jgi:hypothetical protein